MHKLRRAMVRPGRERLAGVVEVDETYWGAEEEGVSGRQTERKALIAVAAEERGRGLGRIRMTRAEIGGQFDALRGGVGRAEAWYTPTAGWATSRAQHRGSRVHQAISAQAPAGSPRPVSHEIWTTTSTSLGFNRRLTQPGSAASRRLRSSSPTGTLRPREPNHKMLGHLSQDTPLKSNGVST